VVVRYIPATPPPSPAPPPPSAAPPPPPPTPAPVHTPNYVFVAGDYLFNPKVYNAFSPGNGGAGSYSVRGGITFDAIGLPFMLEADYENFQYPHNCGAPSGAAQNSPSCFVTVIGGKGSTFVPAFTAVNRDIDARLGFRIFQPHVYIAVAYDWGSNNYGYPNVNAIGGGLEKLPDYGHAFTYYGYVYYFPNWRGTYTTAANAIPPNESFGVGYNLLKYKVGISYAFVPAIAIEAGWDGENAANKNNAPISFSANGAYAGLLFFVPF
jgi:hypothetical protein